MQKENNDTLKKLYSNDLSNFPSPLLRGLFVHDLEEERNLFEFNSSSDSYCDWSQLSSSSERIDDLRESYSNEWTLAEIEILIAIFWKAKGENSITVKSEFELIKIASGNVSKEQRSRHLSGALESLQRERTFILNQNGMRFCKVHPISIEKKDKEIKIALARPIILFLGSWIKIPLAPSRFFRKGGLRRVERTHLLLYLYLIDRIRSNKKSRMFTTKPLFKAMGVSHYFEQRNGIRARKILLSGLKALNKANVLLSFQELSSDLIQLEPNPFHFGIKTEGIIQEGKGAQVTQKGAQVTQKGAQVTQALSQNALKRRFA